MPWSFPEGLKLWLARPLSQALLIAFAMVLLIQGGIWVFKSTAAGWTEEALKELTKDSPRAELAEMSSDVPPELKARLAQQLVEVRGYEAFHLWVVKFFMARYYMAVTMGWLLGLVAAVVLFFVGKNGWSQADPRLVAILIVGSAGATYFYAFPAVFQQQENLTQNLALYLQYRDLENEILTFAATGKSPHLAPARPPEGATAPSPPSDGGTPTTAAAGEVGQPADDVRRFILVTDEQMKNLHKLAIGIDYSKIRTAITVGDSNTAPGNSVPASPQTTPTKGTP